MSTREFTAAQRAALVYRMVGTAMRRERDPRLDVEILNLAREFTTRSADPIRAHDDLIVGMAYVLAGVMLEASGNAGLTREEAAFDVMVLAGTIEMQEGLT